MADDVSVGRALLTNALSMAAARAFSPRCLRGGHRHHGEGGDKLAAGLHAHIDRARLPWSVNVKLATPARESAHNLRVMPVVRGTRTMPAVA